jgi:hypothetical protein
MAGSSRSPLKDNPLRVPGQSLDEERQRLFEREVESWALVGVMLAVMAVLEWWRHFVPRPPSPWLFTLVAAVPLAVAGWRMAKLRPRMRQLRQGIAGERAVGQFLERVREQGYHVFHDVIGTGFNIDHVCIGPAGVFSIETKTWSKPVGRDARVQHQGTQIMVDGVVPDRDPVRQAHAQSTWLARLLEDSAGRKPPVKPVILFPGWYVQADDGAQQALWVLEPKALPQFLAHEPLRLSPEDVRLFAFHLSRFVRVTQTSEALR